MGRDKAQMEIEKIENVSIHAAAWAATVDCRQYTWTIGGFNPRGRMGRDAETGGGRSGPAGFNPRGRMGRDQHRPEREQEW